ncbi:uncharacterized protein LOC125376919 [Haliotis rufescens]|uniref:uncharacterized protein LOC125376919 n=1 Tax=Haliotis rufescens TaxID=6454 RepID=UPI00201F98B7|nr:uncharacterized protein LOC125376919 [Haliotis rufescens]
MFRKDDDDMVSGIVNCGPYIDFPDISDFIQEKQHRLLGVDRKVLQCCYSVLGGEPDWVWRNASMEVYGRFLTVKFYARSQCNKYVVSINNEEVTSQCVHRGLRLKLRDGFRSVFSWIADTAQTVLGAVAGGGMGMLTFH